MAGDHDHLDARAWIEVFEQIDSAAVGQLQIREHDVRHLPDQLDARLAQIGCGGGSQAIFPDDGGKRLAGARVVVDNQYVWHRVSKARKREWGSMLNSTLKQAGRWLFCPIQVPPQRDLHLLYGKKYRILDLI